MLVPVLGDIMFPGGCGLLRSHLFVDSLSTLVAECSSDFGSRCVRRAFLGVVDDKGEILLPSCRRVTDSRVRRARSLQLLSTNTKKL